MWLAFYAGRIMEGTESIRQTLGMPAELLEWTQLGSQYSIDLGTEQRLIDLSLCDFAGERASWTVDPINHFRHCSVVGSGGEDDSSWPGINTFRSLFFIFSCFDMECYPHIHCTSFLRIPIPSSHDHLCVLLQGHVDGWIWVQSTEEASPAPLGTHIASHTRTLTRLVGNR